MSRSKARKIVIPLQAYYVPDESLLVLGNARAVVAAIKMPELQERLAPPSRRKQRHKPARAVPVQRQAAK